MASSSVLDAELTWLQRNRIRSSRRRRCMKQAVGMESFCHMVPQLADRFDTLHTVDHVILSIRGSDAPITIRPYL
jgi:hypothetical protein